MNRPRIVVIGGGLAGLRAAVQCADEGADVTLLEARKRLGGVTWSRFHRGLGFEIDNGQHVFMRCCESYLEFLERLGVRDRVALQDRLNVPIAMPGRRPGRVRRAPLPAPAHLAPSLLRFPTLGLRDRMHAGRTALRFSGLDPEDPALDDKSLGDWLAEQGESDRSIDRLWDMLIRSTLNLSARDASLGLAARVLRTGFLDRSNGADIGWSRVPLDQLHAEPARKALEARGAEVRTGAPVDAIELSSSTPLAVYSKGTRFSADAVILATTHDVAARLLPRSDGFDRAGLAQLPSSPIVNLHAVFDRRVTEHELVAGLDTDLQWTFDRTDSVGLGRGQYLTVSLSAADRWLGHSSSTLRAVFEPQFRSLFPRAREARMEKFAVTIERSATFRAAPGTRRVRPRAGSEVAGIYLAGAWTHTGWPATMEGAVRSGLSAARAALSACVERGSRTREAA
jgi:squalene-associated FAD-dependent desaturase